MKLWRPLMGLIMLGWSIFGLATIRTDLAILRGQALYVPEFSLLFEIGLFIVLTVASILITLKYQRGSD